MGAVLRHGARAAFSSAAFQVEQIGTAGRSSRSGLPSSIVNYFAPWRRYGQWFSNILPLQAAFRPKSAAYLLENRPVSRDILPLFPKSRLYKLHNALFLRIFAHTSSLLSSTIFPTFSQKAECKSTQMLQKCYSGSEKT